MEMMQDIYIDGGSARTLGVYVSQLDPPPMAAPRYGVYSVGSDDDMTIPDYSFDDIEYTVTFRIIGEPAKDNTALYSYFVGAQKLVLSILPRYFFKVKKVSGITPSSRYRGNEQTYNVTFTLSPWKYIDAEPESTVDDNGGYISGTGTRYSKPLYTLTLSESHGEGSILVNGEEFEISIPNDVTPEDDTIIIDAEKALVYDGGGNNMMMYTAGDIPFMTAGNNHILPTGIVSGVTVKPNGRCY